MIGCERCRPTKQQEALRLLDKLASEPYSEPHGTRVDRRPIWEIIEQINGGLPKDTWAVVPTDGSINLDLRSAQAAAVKVAFVDTLYFVVLFNPRDQ